MRTFKEWLIEDSPAMNMNGIDVDGSAGEQYTSNNSDDANSNSDTINDIIHKFHTNLHHKSFQRGAGRGFRGGINSSKSKQKTP